LLGYGSQQWRFLFFIFEGCILLRVLLQSLGASSIAVVIIEIVIKITFEKNTVAIDGTAKDCNAGSFAVLPTGCHLTAKENTHNLVAKGDTVIECFIVVWYLLSWTWPYQAITEEQTM
jgi:hypothetical protein